MGDNVYVGPFFISCDHGCGHGAGSHGAGVTCEEEGYRHGDDGGRRDSQVFAKSYAGIKACDLFIAWADECFSSAYGTMTELGMAYAYGTTIVLISRPLVTLNDQWFPRECAKSLHFTSDDPAVGVQSLLHTMRTISELDATLKDRIYETAKRAVGFLNRLNWYRENEHAHQERVAEEEKRAIAKYVAEEKTRMDVVRATYKEKTKTIPAGLTRADIN